MVTRGLQQNVGKFFFVDSDMLLDQNTFLNMIAANMPVISAAYMSRSPPFDMMANLQGHQLKREVVAKNPVRQYITVDEVGMGACLIDRLVFERIAKMLNTWRCMTDHKPEGLDTSAKYSDAEARQQGYQCKLCGNLLVAPFFWSRIGFFDHDAVSEDYWFCFPKGTNVYTKYGVVDISEIKKGDLVLTHRGTLRRVLDTHKREYHGDICIINAYGTPTIRATTNHPILTKTTVSSANRCGVQLVTMWKNAEYIRAGDSVFVPASTYASNTVGISSIDISDYIESDSKTIRLDPDIFRLFGYYLAEGSGGKNHLQITFSANENEYVLDSIELLKLFLGVKSFPHYSIERKTMSVNCSSTTTAKLFRVLFGHLAKNKSIHMTLMDMNSEQAKELIRGYWFGDGSYDRKRNVFSFTTVSKTLAYQVRFILLRLGVLSTIYSHKDVFHIHVNRQCNIEFETIVDIISSRRELAYSQIRKISHLKLNNACGIRGGFWIKVKSTHREHYYGYVYNLSVDEHNSYLVDGVAVHNCKLVNKAGFDVTLVNNLIVGHEPRIADWFINQDGLQTRNTNAGDIKSNPNKTAVGVIPE